jgi:feruloyl esterase
MPRAQRTNSAGQFGGREASLSDGLIAAIVVAVALTTTVRADATVAKTCASLTSLAIPDVTIASADEVPAGPFTPPGAPRPLTIASSFCRVTATATPTPDSQIRIEVWIPSGEAWNGKLLGTANGGFSGAIGYPALAAGIAKGYAAASTDTGHTGDSLDFAPGHPEKIADWAYRSIHVMTDTAKVVVRAARGRFPDLSYFEGCSTGGQQALSEAQRYPRDYDGIVAGDPGNNRVRLILGFLWSWNAAHDADGRAILPTSKLPLLTKSAVAACDANDGVKDGLIADPRSCRFDPATIACKGEDGDACLTGAQVSAVQKIYDGPRNPRTGESIFPGWARGSEQGWGTYIVNPKEPMRIAFLRDLTFADPAWDPRSFDWDKDVAFADDRIPNFGALSRDLRAFKANSGKLIMYTGWADPVTPPQDTVNYYEGVEQEMGGRAETEAFLRFFPVPGMGHCGGGAGPSTFDALAALDAWRAYGRAPDQLAGSHSTNGVVDRTRPICAYPALASYRGSGSIDAAESFTCAAPRAQATSTKSKGR